MAEQDEESVILRWRILESPRGPPVYIILTDNDRPLQGIRKFSKRSPSMEIFQNVCPEHMKVYLHLLGVFVMPRSSMPTLESLDMTGSVRLNSSSATLVEVGFDVGAIDFLVGDSELLEAIRKVKKKCLWRDGCEKCDRCTRRGIACQRIRRQAKEKDVAPGKRVQHMETGGLKKKPSVNVVQSPPENMSVLARLLARRPVKTQRLISSDWDDRFCVRTLSFFVHKVASTGSQEYLRRYLSTPAHVNAEKPTEWRHAAFIDSVCDTLSIQDKTELVHGQTPCWAHVEGSLLQPTWELVPRAVLDSRSGEDIIMLCLCGGPRQLIQTNSRFLGLFPNLQKKVDEDNATNLNFLPSLITRMICNEDDKRQAIEAFIMNNTMNQNLLAPWEVTLTDEEGNEFRCGIHFGPLQVSPTESAYAVSLIPVDLFRRNIRPASPDLSRYLLR